MYIQKSRNRNYAVPAPKVSGENPPRDIFADFNERGCTLIYD